MLCKICNTRISNGRTSCPNCGSHSLSKLPAGESSPVGKLPDLNIEADIDPPEKDPAEVVELDRPAPDESEVDMALEEAVGEERRATEDREAERPAPATDAWTIKRELPLETQERRAATRRPLAAAPDSAGVRRLLADAPELLERGLSVYTNERGTPLGAGYTSAVGEIDLLARDPDGGLVVVMVAEPHEGPDLISAVLQRIGWVRKHLGGGTKRVRGIVVMPKASDAIAYAAAAVSDTVSFKTYRVALTFDDLDY